MSSYYTAAELEAMRKEQIRQQVRRELAAGMQRLKEQLQESKSGGMAFYGGVDIHVTATDDDTGVSGYRGAGMVSAEALMQAKKAGQTVEMEFGGLRQEQQTGGEPGGLRQEGQTGAEDLSALLSAAPGTGRLHQELSGWVEKVNGRAVITEQDERERARLTEKLRELLADETMDIEDKVRFAKMRVTGFLQSGTRMTPEERERQAAVCQEYAVLCGMTGVVPAETVFYRVEEETKRLRELLFTRRQEEYIMEVIGDLMEELGCHVKDEAALDHVDGTLFAVDGHPDCDVFMGNDGSGIMFEPVAETTDGSLDQKRRLEYSANHVCSLYATLEERAAERGVILKRVYLESARAETMCSSRQISEQKKSGSQRRARRGKQKERAMGQE